MKLIFITILSITLFLLSTVVMAQESKSTPSFSDHLLFTVVSAVVACIFGAISSFCVAYLKTRELDKTFNLKVKELQAQFGLKVKELQTQMDIQQTVEKKNQQINLRLKYINPLRNATNKLADRLSLIRLKMNNKPELDQMKKWFQHIKQFCEQDLGRDERAFKVWCHYEGIFAMTTIHYTATYFSYVVAISTLDPFREVNHTFAIELAKHLNYVKKSFNYSEVNGLWAESQDSAGSVLLKDLTVMSVMNYEEFCTHLIDTSSGPNYGPFLRLIDFYREHLYTDSEIIIEIKNSLINLQNFLNTPAKV